MKRECCGRRRSRPSISASDQMTWDIVMASRIRTGACMVIVAAVLAGNAATAAQVAARPACDRRCLEGFVDNYLDALAAHDVQRARLAADVRVTENGVAVAPGEGLWKTAACPHRLPHPRRGRPHRTGRLHRHDRADRRQIADAGAAPQGRGWCDPRSRNGHRCPVRAAGRAAHGIAAPVACRSRCQCRSGSPASEMIAVANRNFDGIVAADGSHFARTASAWKTAWR